MNELNYDEIRELAIQKGVKDTKVSIGMWAKFNGYIKYKRIIKDNKFMWIYRKYQNDESN